MSKIVEHMEGGAARKPRWVRAIHVFSWIVAVPGLVAVFGLMLHITADLTSRGVANKPLLGTYELVTYYWMPMISFSALALSLLRGEQIRATMLTERLPRGLRIFADLLALGCLFIFAVAFTYFGFEEAQKAREAGEWMVSSVEILVWPIRYIVPLGGIALCLQIISMLPDVFKTPDSESLLEQESAEVL